MRRLIIEAWDGQTFFAEKKLEVHAPGDLFASVDLSRSIPFEVPEDVPWLQFRYAGMDSNRISLDPERSRIIVRKNQDHPSHQRAAGGAARNDPIGPFIEEMALRFAARNYAKHAAKKNLPPDPLIAEWAEGA